MTLEENDEIKEGQKATDAQYVSSTLRIAYSIDSMQPVL
jgi:hypothetical protein